MPGLMTNISDAVRGARTLQTKVVSGFSRLAHRSTTDLGIYALTRQISQRLTLPPRVSRMIVDRMADSRLVIYGCVVEEQKDKIISIFREFGEAEHLEDGQIWAALPKTGFFKEALDLPGTDMALLDVIGRTEGVLPLVITSFSPEKAPKTSEVAGKDATETDRIKANLERHILVDTFKIVVDTERSQGSYLYDIEGKRYVDFYSYFASAAIGHNHPVFATVDWNKVGPHLPAHADVLTREYERYIAALASIAPRGLPKISHINATGSRAIDSALKACFHHRPWATRVLSAKKGFHGRGLGPLSATDSKKVQKWGYPRFNWPKFNFPTFIEGDEKGNFAQVEKALKQIEKELKKGRLACVLVEPIQGEGGDNHAEIIFWQSLRWLTRKYNVPLVLDEVQSGKGMTGKMWAYEWFDIVPDIVVFSKKGQVSGYFSTEQYFVNESGRINSTTGGSLTDMVRARLIIETIQKENLLENVKVQGAYLKGELQRLANEHSDLVTRVRGEGLMLAFNLPNPKTREMLYSRLMKNGLLALRSGTRAIRFRPLLDVKREDVIEGIKILEATLKELQGEKDFQAAAREPYSDEHSLVEETIGRAEDAARTLRAYLNDSLGLRLDREVH